MKNIVFYVGIIFAMIITINTNPNLSAQEPDGAVPATEFHPGNIITWGGSLLTADQDTAVMDAAKTAFEGDDKRMIMDRTWFIIKTETKEAALTWSEFVSTKLYQFFSESSAYPKDTAHINRDRVLEAYGILGAGGNVIEMKWSEVGGGLLNSTEVQDHLWEVTEPVLARAWSVTNPADRHLIRSSIIPDMKEFLENVNIHIERKYLLALRENEGEGKKKVSFRGEFLGEDEFKWTRPDGQTRKNPKLEAFVLRRILNSEITLERMKELLQRVQDAVTIWDKEHEIDLAEDAKASRDTRVPGSITFEEFLTL